MKANVKVIAVIIVLVATALRIVLYPSVTRTVSAENVLAGIIDSRPDDIAFQGWGNIESRHNVFTANPIQRVLVKRPDIFSGIPPNSQITKAILRIYTKDYNTQHCTDTARRTYGAYKITQDWSPSSVTWRNQPSFQSTPTATIQKAPKTDVNQWWEFDVTADIYSPYGWTLKDETEDAYGFFAWNYIVYIETAEIYYEYTPPSYTLTVSVKDSDGNAVSGASVTSPFSDTTDASGQASASLTYGSYSVAISYLGRSYEQSITLDSSKTVSFTIPKYTLTVHVLDSDNNPVQGASIISPVAGKTDANGVFSTNLRRGSYTVTAQADTQTATASVSLDKATTVTLTLSLKYSVQLKIVDQVGNPLLATVTVAGQTLSSNKTGFCPPLSLSGSVNVSATTKVKDRLYNTTDTFTVTKPMTRTLTITRRFFWTFHIKYSDGTLATGTLTLKSAQETLTASISNGYGESYLMDTSYEVTFTSSPEVKITTINVVNDGELSATIDKAMGTTISTDQTTVPVTSPKSPVTSPEIPWILIPSIYIYGLLGVLGFGFILAAVVALRRKQP